MISTRFTILFQDEQPQSRIIYEKKAYRCSIEEETMPKKYRPLTVQIK
jgi:hypothetical protein